MNVEETLVKLGLEDLIGIFQEHNIDDEAVLLLGDDELKELIPKIGPRMKFKKYIESFKTRECVFNIRDEDFSNQQSQQSASVSVTGSLDGVESSASTETLQSTETSEYSHTGCIDGRAILKEGQNCGGLLKEGSRRRLSQLVVKHVIDQRPSRKICTEDFYRLASEIVEIFPKESIVVYYSAYKAGKDTAKKNASGKLYESYITTRRKLRQSGELSGTSRGSSSNSSIENNPKPSVSEIDHEEDITWLKNNVDPWNTVEQKWAETSDYRLKHIYDGSSIIEYFNKYPALKQPNGYTLLLSDFNRMHPGKETCLFSMLELKHTQIISYAKNKAGHARDKNIKTAIQDLIGLIDEENADTVKVVCLILLAYIINISPARKRKGKPALKFSRAEICDGYIKQVSSEADVTSAIIEKREQITRQERTLQPFVIFVGKSVTDVKAAYVVINDTLYHFKKLITAVDCAFKIFQSTGACYPEECEDIWLFIQLGFYDIKTKFDRQAQVVNTLLTDLGLICDKSK